MDIRKGKLMKPLKTEYLEEEKKSKENITTYQLKVEKETWKKFKGTSYLLGFDTPNDCLNHLINDCVNYNARK